MARRGILGGSFNPIHNGHLHLGKTVRDALSLDEILLMPSGTAPHKSSAAYAPAEDRLAMCRLAAEDCPGFAVSDFELRKTGKSYTVETLRALQTQAPADSWFLLVGSDMLLTFTQWYCWEEILRRCTLVCMSRGTEQYAVLEAAAAQLRRYGTVQLVDVPPLQVSSTEIRERIRDQRNYACYLPKKVVQYILLANLYRS